MKGAIIGDIVGSVYEFNSISSKVFPFFSRKSEFTDDTVMTCAVAKVLVDSRGDFSSIMPEKVVKTMQAVARRYPDAGYGSHFIDWVFAKNPRPYNSCGNGSAMRVSPVGFLARSEEEVRTLSRVVTEVTHNHPEGIRGAECTAMCIFLARQGRTKEEIRRKVEDNYYTLTLSCDELRRRNNGHHGREICQVSMPEALQCFFESTSYEDCVRNCVSLGSDCDTVAAIAGAIAEAYYGPESVSPFWPDAEARLDDYLRGIVADFDAFKNSLEETK